MTRLLDTGYLRTNDSVVQACFLGCSVCRLRGGKWINDILGRIEIYSRTILIPARVVAEVCGFPGDQTIEYEHIYIALGAGGLWDWLLQHVKEEMIWKRS